jgi:hypothetical protein
MATDSGMNLTQMAYYGRRTLKFGAIAIVVLMVGRTFLTAAVGYWKATHPEPPPAPTARFGPLPPLHFLTRTAEQKPTSYQLETATGRLPLFGDRAKVFLMERSAPSLLADQQVKQIASQFGFIFPPTILNDRTYRWTKTQPINATLEMDIQNKNFAMTTNFLSQPELFNGSNLPTNTQATELVKTYISSGLALPDDIATSSGETQFLKVNGSGLSPAVSFSDANFIQIDIFRVPIDGKGVFTPDGVTGVIHGIVSGGLTGKNAVVDLTYKYHPVNYFEFDFYPLRSVQSAWQILQAGEGYVANKGTFSTAVIREVLLGYYDDFAEQSYMQPIFIFRGDGGFIGYVPAIDPKLVQSGANTDSATP